MFVCIFRQVVRVQVFELFLDAISWYSVCRGILRLLAGGHYGVPLVILCEIAAFGYHSLFDLGHYRIFVCASARLSGGRVNWLIAAACLPFLVQRAINLIAAIGKDYLST